MKIINSYIEMEEAYAYVISTSMEIRRINNSEQIHVVKRNYIWYTYVCINLEWLLRYNNSKFGNLCTKYTYTESILLFSMHVSLIERYNTTEIYEIVKSKAK